MSPLDTQLWIIFLNKHGANYDKFSYDVKVGSGVSPSSDYSKKFYDDYVELTKKRIDAVGWTPAGAHIFEVKPRAGSAALGQLLMYRDLFTNSYPSYSIASLNVICQLITPEERILYSQHNIVIYEFPVL